MNKRNLGIVIGVCVVVIVALVLVFTIGPLSHQPTPAKTYKIGVFQIVEHPALNAARQGFEDALTAAVNATGGNVTYNEQNAQGEPSNAATIAQSFVAEGVDLICAIATPCVQAAALAVNQTGIPVVFNSVTNPVVAGVVNNWTVPGGQVTGVSDIAPVEPQLELIGDILAANNLTFGRLGVIYNPGEDNSVYQVDTQLPEAITALNLTLEVVKSPAYSTADVSAAAEALVGKVDAIWVPTDNTAVAAFEAIVAVAQENDIPLFAADTSTVERGAIGCWGLNYYDIGYASGEMAADILLNGANPATMPVQTAPANLLYLNTIAANETGVTIPQALIDKANTVY